MLLLADPATFLYYLKRMVTARAKSKHSTASNASVTARPQSR
jgi:hypothetical protein